MNVPWRVSQGGTNQPQPQPSCPVLSAVQAVLKKLRLTSWTSVKKSIGGPVWVSWVFFGDGWMVGWLETGGCVGWLFHRNPANLTCFENNRRYTTYVV